MELGIDEQLNKLFSNLHKNEITAVGHINH